MKIGAPFFVVSSLLASACATLDVAEIRGLDRTEFEALQLVPDTEPNELRIDLIRQTKEDYQDSTYKTKLVPYHPLGFDLGNGLFFDANQNLSLRLDYLLDLTGDQGFAIRHIARPKRNKGINVYSLHNDSQTYHTPTGRTRDYYHTAGSSDSLIYLRKNRFLYSIVSDDSILAYGNKRRMSDIIYQVDDATYRLQRGRRREYDYKLNGNSVLLEDDYIVSTGDNDTRLDVFKTGKRRTKKILTIVRDKGCILVYNKHYKGKKILFDENGILVYENKVPVTRYERDERFVSK